MAELASEGGRDGPIEWAIKGRALRGEAVSGDARVALATPAGMLLGVIDGLGHGPEAADAAAQAVEVLSAHPNEPVGELVDRCHLALHATRGVAMSIAALDVDGRKLEWVGVGNVESILLRERAARGDDGALLLRGGVVGYRLPPLRPARVQLRPGDTLVMASDGVDPAFAWQVDRLTAPAPLARRLLERHARDGDDALVLVARYHPDPR